MFEKNFKFYSFLFFLHLLEFHHSAPWISECNFIVYSRVFQNAFVGYLSPKV